MIGILGRMLSTGFALLAAGGLAAAVAVHVASLAGANLLGERMSGWALLHVGVFLVMLPMAAAIVLERLCRRHRTGLPWRWTRITTMALFVYCLATLAWMAVGARAGASASGNSPVSPIQSARIFSTGWMLFYFLAAAFFAPRALGRD